MSRTRNSQWLWACVALLFIAFVLRAHAIEALPPFNDESHHIRRAEDIYTFTNRDLNLTLGKLLSYYWIGAFGAERLDAIFIGRTVTALFALLGLAGTYATGKLLFNRQAGMIALILAVFSPFMIFFDRLALTDPLTSSVGILLIAASIKLVSKTRHNQLGDWWAVWVGLLCGLVVMAKLLGLPMIMIPLLAYMVFGDEVKFIGWRPKQLVGWLRETWQTYRPALITVYGTFTLTMVPFIWHIIDRTIINPQFLPIVNNNLINGAAEEKSPPQVIVGNLETLWETHWILHSPILWIVMIAASVYVVYKYRAIGLYLLGSIALTWSLSIIVAAELSTRYLTLGVLPTLVVVGIGLAIILKQSPPWSKLIIYGVIGIWIGAFSLPFVQSAWNEPKTLTLPERDQWEYYENFSAGYGLVAVADVLPTLPRSEPSGRVNVLGLVGSCHQMRLYLDENGPVWLECPFFGWQGENMDAVAEEIEIRAQNESVVYLLVEPELEFTDLSRIDVRWELVDRYPRPHDGMTVELYRIYPKNS